MAVEGIMKAVHLYLCSAWYDVAPTLPSKLLSSECLQCTVDSAVEMASSQDLIISLGLLMF